MNFLFVKPLNLMSLGFLLGFIIILITYIVSYYQTKRIPQFKKSILFLITLIALIYTPKIPILLKIYLMISLIIFAAIINSILVMLIDLISTFYKKDVNKNKIEKIKQIIYLCLSLVGIGLIAGGSIKFVTYSHYFVRQLILLGLGVWLSLKLLYARPENCEN